MAYNFKSIADVEVVAEPTEFANVLIEENGIIKKAPKTAVGGGGGHDELIVVISSGHDVIMAPDDLHNKIKEIFQTYTLHLLNVYIFSPTDGENPSVIMRTSVDQIYDYGDWYQISLSNNYYRLEVYSNGELNFYYND